MIKAASPVLLPARTIVVAPRLPAFPKRYEGLAESAGDLVADCGLCGWHAMGPRALVKKAADEHHRLFHPDEIGVVLLNQARQ